MSARDGTQRLLRVTLASPSFGAYGGVQAVMLAIARCLRDERIEVHLCFKLVEGASISSSFEEVLTRSGLRYTVTTRASAREFVRALRWADVVHMHTPSPDIAAVTRILGRPLAVTVHNHRSEHRGRTLKSRAAMCLSHRVWFTSDFVADTWRMAVAPPRFEKAPTVADLPTAIVPPSQRRGFVAVARLVENKGMDDLVRAYALAKIRHADAPLTIIGDGPLKMMIAEVAVKSGVAAHVAMPGFVDARARDAAIRSARWLVAPAKTHEDLGLTPIEARHVGVPCIVTRDGGLPEAAGKESLLCDPGDVAGLTHCIEAAANCNEDEYVTRSERTRAELLAYLRPLSWFSDRYRVMAADHRRGRRKSGPLGH